MAEVYSRYIMKIHKLMIKTHNITGLKYLCYTTTEGDVYNNYKGSGKYWKRHIKKYGDDISTELIFETEDYDMFKDIAIKKSLEFNIVESKDWANLKIEDGCGGDTVSNKRWITDGNNDMYIYKTENLPDGWNYGRSKCVFNNKENQRYFNSLVDQTKKGKSIKLAWDCGKFLKRDNTKCGVKGELNPAKREDVKIKISKAISKKVNVMGKEFSSIKEASLYFSVSYYIIKKWIRQCTI